MCVSVLQLVVTGLTKIKLGDTFADMPNLSLATSNGLVYSWGRNLLTPEEWEEQHLRQQLIMADGLDVESTASGQGTWTTSGTAAESNAAVVASSPATNALSTKSVLSTKSSYTPAENGETTDDGRTILIDDDADGRQ